MKDVAIQFFNGIDDSVIPQISLTRSKYGKSGKALFRFDNTQELISSNF